MASFTTVGHIQNSQTHLRVESRGTSKPTISATAVDRLPASAQPVSGAFYGYNYTLGDKAFPNH